MSFRFGFDVTSIPKTPAGVGNYILHLAQSLIKQVNQSNDTLFIFGRSDQKDTIEFKNSNFIDCGQLNTLRRIIWEQIQLPGLIKKHNIDLFHSPNYSIPLRATCKKVCTIHDLTCYIFPRRRKMVHGLYFRKMIKNSVNHADFIIADSINTKNDIEKTFNRKLNNIRVIYPGFNTLYSNTRLNKEKRKNKPYFLFISTIEPSKNVEGLIRVFSKFVKENSSFHLFLAGKPGWGYKKIIQMIHDPVSGKNIHYLGYQTNDQLADLYTNAFAFIYPSLYEGFGIPPLESMACGIPVLCSNASSIPEVVGEAGLYFDPYNDEEMLQAMKTIAENTRVRKSLINKGYEQTKLFTYEKSAKKVLQVYHKVLN